MNDPRLFYHTTVFSEVAFVIYLVLMYARYMSYFYCAYTVGLDNNRPIIINMKYLYGL